MSNKFKVVKVRDTGKVITGKTPSSKNPDEFGEKFMFITPSDDWESKNIYDSKRCISETGYEKFKSKIIEPNNILVSCIGSAMGKVVINKSKCLTNQQINTLVVNKLNYDYNYLYYQLIYNHNTLRLKAKGSTSLPNLNKKGFENISLRIHNNFETQKQIAKVLSDLDAKIEVNNQINAKLEAMAKTLYEYWFVQFDFPDAEGKPYKSSGGRMVYNEELRREIPDGWEVKTIKDLIKSDKNGDWGKAEHHNNYVKKVNCIRGADLNGLNGQGNTNSPTRFILEKNEHKFLNSGDFIIEISGGSPTQSTGRIGMVIDETFERFNNDLICSNFCRAISLNDEYFTFNFLQFWNRMYKAGVLFGWEGKTSGIKNFLFDSFISKYKIALPNNDLTKAYYNAVKPYYSKIQKNLVENKKLAELRNWLLPMLMNGQVTVREVHDELERVAEEKSKYYEL